MRGALILTIAVLAFGASAAGTDDLPFQLSSSLPESILRVLENDPKAKQYALVAHLNPFYLHGDFNGDGRTDVAVLVKNKESGKIGVAILHSGARSAIILGAGRDFGNGGDDFRWMDACICTRARLSNRVQARVHHPSSKGTRLCSSRPNQQAH